jgi:D-glycero-D-manno-heptose 1,7-bisphosphate phosphatase
MRELGYDLLIFDADDTLRRTTVPGRPCPRSADEWELLPNVAATLRALPWHRLRYGVASNQDRVAFGELSEEAARELLRSLAVEATGIVPDEDAVQLCPHAKRDGCTCRKPAPALLRRIMTHFGIPPERTLFVGDAPRDRGAARRAGTAFQWAHDFFGWNE